MKPSTLRHGLNLWPPFLFTGIHVTDISPDWCHARVELRMRPWNRNYLRTHFGGIKQCVAIFPFGCWQC